MHKVAESTVNSEGGRIYWGVGDDRIPTGIRLNGKQRDELQRAVTDKLGGIQPHLDPSQFRIAFHSIIDDVSYTSVEDLFVMEVVVPRVDNTEPYFTSNGLAYIRLDGCVHELKGPKLVAWIRGRMAKGGS